MKRKKGALRLQCARAKNRLVTGFWNQQHEKASLQNIVTANNEEEQFYKLVANLLREGISPLAQILDHAHMETLDDASRQRYVLNISSRVQKSVERYNQVC